MARPILIGSFSMQKLPFSSMPVTVFFVVMGVLSMFSVVSFLCGSKKMKKLSIKRQKGNDNKKILAKLNSNISSRAISMAKMISWRKVQAEEEEEEDYDDDDDEAVWRKTIMMGERCRPLDFSGKIVYDSEGNVVQDLSDLNEQEKKFIVH
ncbi:putative Transmembrane protein [Quillaja saponaria]|uniref:Transmembrane protein n=1 Tax=Quillaja saponaria TaxID=32244 RepID=A0AAD7LNA7_QUISA|nr:putative Transmembrane protein [Quillaja saponaria]